ncbi:MAG: acyl-CoA dehydrogenase family protein [Dokdonella sp.]
MNMPADFIQPAVQLGNTYRSDRVLQGWLASELPAPMRAAIAADLDELGANAANAWRDARGRTPELPTLTQWDAWGARIDRIESTTTWLKGPQLTARYGFVAAGHETTWGEHARIDQFMRVYLYHVASEFFTCPLAMSDGAATALKASGNEDLIERALPRLLARDADQLWLSGQWMTETAGGSDVGNTGTTAVQDADGQWRLHGRKWFTSAVVGEMALTLSRPQGGAAGTQSLALFYLETRRADGSWNGIQVDRLKNKLGTHELPTAEIHLDGVPAQSVGELGNGVRMIAPMLNVTRTWNAVCALASMRRCIALACDYAQHRQVFGRSLIEQPLHRATLVDMQVEFEAAFHLVFDVVRLLGRSETALSSPRELALLRVLTPLAKLWTAKLAVSIASETCEAFGGAGYIENTGIPQLLRDAQVYPIWEGTSNVLALDSLRALASIGSAVLLESLSEMLTQARSEASLRQRADTIEDALQQSLHWLQQYAADRAGTEAGARGFALSVARTFAAATLCRHAAANPLDARPRGALHRFIQHGLLRLTAAASADEHDLLDDAAV